MDVKLGRGVADLLWGLGEQAFTVEMTLDFESDVLKSAVAYPGASEPECGFQCMEVDGLDLWWRQRLVLATREPRTTDRVKPRRLVVERLGRALRARAHYA